ncbi:MAG: NAD-dependent epimerase [Deltaproteobacteria bacterium]|nr:NAD-dependent epimerase [Deltaproteobacteria bacterium]
MKEGIPIFISGAAGFIGFHLARRLLEAGRPVVGVDNLNEYYDVNLKKARLKRLKALEGFEFVEADIADGRAVEKIFQKHSFEKVLHLAAQAGVRYSLTHPQAYVQSNLAGFLNVLESCRRHRPQHLVFASSSSVYGANKKIPFSEHDGVNHPVSLYAATKRANELMAHSYAHLYGTPCTGLRYFTVYGPWGRPDMALFLFTKAILNDVPIEVFNHGNMERDFTYIDDVVEGTLRVLQRPPTADPNWDARAPDPASASAPFRIYNIGNNSPVHLMSCIEILEECLGKKSVKNYREMQPGDLPQTYADISDLAKDFSWRPKTSLKEGISRFVQWYREYYSVLG